MAGSITYDARYVTYKAFINASGTAHHEHVQGVDDHGAPREAFPILDDKVEDGFADGWEDEDLEEWRWL